MNGHRAIKFGLPVAALAAVLAGIIISNVSDQSTAYDGRLNSDGAAKAVVYCDGGISVWTVNNDSVGVFAFNTSMQQAANGMASAANSGTHQLIGQGDGATLWALNNGREFQVQHGNYNFVFSSSSCGDFPAANGGVAIAQQPAAAPSNSTTNSTTTTTTNTTTTNTITTTTTTTNQSQPADWRDKTSNRCQPGHAWGDGRCNDPDPARQEFLWQQGWYYQRVDDGDIQELDMPIQYVVGYSPDLGIIVVPGAPAPPAPAPGPGPAPSPTCFTDPPLDISPHLPDVSSMGDEAAVLALVNAARSHCGQSTLTANGLLDTASALHSQDMVTRSYFDHDAPPTAPNGTTPGDRATAAGYTWSAIGENIASGQTTPTQVFLAWWNSSGHRANILRANYTEMGLGRVNNVWTQLFGRP